MSKYKAFIRMYANSDGTQQFLKMYESTFKYKTKSRALNAAHIFIDIKKSDLLQNGDFPINDYFFQTTVFKHFRLPLSRRIKNKFLGFLGIW